MTHFETGWVDVQLSHDGSEWTQGILSFEFIDAMVVSSVSPSQIRVDTLVTVDVLGSNFRNNINFECLFDGSPVSAAWVSTELVRCLAPQHKDLVTLTVAVCAVFISCSH